MVCMSVVSVVVGCCSCHLVHELITASVSRCCGILLKKPGYVLGTAGGGWVAVEWDVV